MSTLAKYTLNSAIPPVISHDNGFLDSFQPRAPTQEERASYRRWRAKLEAGEAIQGIPFIPKNDLPDALAAYRHFLEASGKPRDVRIERYFQNDASGRIAISNAAIEAQNAAFELHRTYFRNKDASFHFVGSKLQVSAQSARFPYPRTENWQKAVGAFPFWLSGVVDVEIIDHRAHFDLTFTFHMEDMYNFNPGQKDIATGIPDSENGVFSITGLAKQYLNKGTAFRRVKWVGQPSGIPKLMTSDGRREAGSRRTRRERKPADNLRLRNRV